MLGYAAFTSQRYASRGLAPKALHFMGAELVLTDLASGQVCNRPGFKALSKIMRKGDRLVIDRPASLGTKPEYQERNMARIEAMGVELMVLVAPHGAVSDAN